MYFGEGRYSVQSSTNRILNYTKGVRRYMVLGIFATVLAVFFNMATPKIIGFTVDNVLDSIPAKLPHYLDFIRLPTRDFLIDNLWLLAVAVAVVTAGRAIFAFIYRYAYSKFTEDSMKKLRDDLYGHISRLPYSWHSQHQTGDIIQRCTSDINLIKQFFAGQLLELVRTIIMIIMATATMLNMNLILAAIALLFIPIVITYSLIFYKYIHRGFKRSDEAEAALHSGSTRKSDRGARGACLWQRGLRARKV